MNETIFTNRCSFCGKQQDQVERLIAGPRGMFICNECIDLCREIIEEKGMIAFFSTESPLFLLCASCGARCRRTDHYCFNCGQKLEQKASSDFSKQALLAEASPHQHRQNHKRQSQQKRSTFLPGPVWWKQSGGVNFPDQGASRRGISPSPVSKTPSSWTKTTFEGMADTYHVFLHFRHFQEMACYRLSWP